ncbi:MAG: DEAD/DEAH box helicase [Kiritimatiellia bacterium]
MKVIKKLVRNLLGDKPARKKTTKKKNSSDNRKTASGGVKKRGSVSDKQSGSSKAKSKKTGGAKGGSAKAKPRDNNSTRSRSADKSSGKRKQNSSKSSSRPDSRGKGSSRKNSSRKSSNNRSSRSGRPAAEGRISAANNRVAKPSRAGNAGRNSRGQRPGGGISAGERAELQEAHAQWSLDKYQVKPAEGKKRFQDFDLPSEIMHAVADLKFEYCTPIQALSLEHSLAGKNVAGRAQTGTGKTAAFLIAIFARYLRSPEKKQEQSGCPRALVIAPTRELVIQICKDASSIGKYCGLRTLAVYGGMDYQRQKDEVLAEPIDLLVATPGRLLDYCRRRVINLSQVDTLVIDEADRMLDMGFIPDVRLIMNKLPRKDKRCTMLYSATLTKDVMRLASQWMEEPVSVEVESDSVATDTVEQVVYVVTASEKFTVLYNLLQKYPDQRILVFCNRKATTESVVRKLRRLRIPCDMLSGDVSQNRRLRVLEDFRSGKSRIVIATDVAGRGIHVDDIGFVVNYDFPYEAEDYVHRIGRTGRAGHQGTAISFADEDESFIIPDIEEYIKEPLKCTLLMGNDPLMADIPKPERSQRKPVSRRKTEPVKKSSEEKRDTAVEQDKTAKKKKPVKTAESTKSADSAGKGKDKKADQPERPSRKKSVQSGASRKTATQNQGKSVAGKPAPRKPRFSDEWVPGQ